VLIGRDIGMRERDCCVAGKTPPVDVFGLRIPYMRVQSDLHD
jgi:hypothetical protein